MKYLKNTNYFSVLYLTILSLFILACNQNKESKPVPKPGSVAEKKAMQLQRKKWEASPDGKMYLAWQSSAEGKKVRASYDKIKKSLANFSEMEAVVTSVTFQRENAKSTGPKWLLVRIMNENYMLQFVPKEFEQLKSLHVNDKISIKSHNAGFSPNHPYLILSSDYIAKSDTVLFKRIKNKNNKC
ncbi:MAG: hypothetical protein RLZ77_1827 [Bacteroidota bacterium]|jgi:hypothetical protein